MPKPSYIDGMYPLVGRPKYPSLWRGCVGAWAPCLGPSGLTLYDWSPYKNHGTLTNMVPADDWVISGGRCALDFDGSNDRIDIASTTNTQAGSGVSFTFTGWFYKSPDATRQVILSKFDNSTNCEYLLWFNLSDIPRWDVYSNDGATQNTATWGSTITSGDNQWHFFCVDVNNNANTISISIDNQTPVSAARTVTQTAGTAALQLGAASSLSWWLDGAIDDVRRYDRVINPATRAMLSRRRGIAYEVAERQFDPGTNRRRRVLIGV